MLIVEDEPLMASLLAEVLLGNGFAAETAADTGELLAIGRAKLDRKGCDLLVVNDVGRAVVFGAADNEVLILATDGSVTEVPRRSKAAVADGCWDAVVRKLADR
jgi:phosphopantothenoylcysteine decarboxylase/phosphopantothenate--cysteine ligase